ncbi:uncharacterized protein [Macrobrachium rosenbergii]|uniref:uncharacterized protein n=1 Tax=Macrobrachium rosenbergii TaxID=79674 RepID=UPI0034D4C5CC
MRLCHSRTTTLLPNEVISASRFGQFTAICQIFSDQDEHKRKGAPCDQQWPCLLLSRACHRCGFREVLEGETPGPLSSSTSAFARQDLSSIELGVAYKIQIAWEKLWWGSKDPLLGHLLDRQESSQRFGVALRHRANHQRDPAPLRPADVRNGRRSEGNGEPAEGFGEASSDATHDNDHWPQGSTPSLASEGWDRL